MPYYNSYKDNMPEFANIPCEIVGWCRYTDLEKVKEIPGQTFDGTRFVKASGKLRNTLDDWAKLAKMI